MHGEQFINARLCGARMSGRSLGLEVGWVHFSFVHLARKLASRLPKKADEMGFRPMFLLDAGESKELIPLKLFYAVQYFGFSVQTYLAIYFETKADFTKSQIGVLLAMPCICTIIAPPLWGAIADSLRKPKTIHVVCHITSALLYFSIQFVSSFPLMCVLMFIASFQMAPAFSLMDLATMTWVTRVGGDFGKQRLYAAVGYGIGGYLCGLMVSSVGINWCFNMLLVASSISLFLLVRYIPDPAETTATANADPSEIRDDGSESAPKKGLLLRTAKQIMSMHDVLLLLVTVVLSGIIDSLINNYLLLFVYNLSGEDGNITGVFIAIQTVSELPYFFLANKIIAKFGTPMCVTVSVVAYGVRAIVYTFTKHPWWILPVETLHGITFGLLLAALTNYIYASAPKGAEGTMIGLISASQRGIGGGIASLAGGYVYGKYGARTMWGSAGFGICPLALVFVAAFAWEARRRRRAASELGVQLIGEAGGESALPK